MTSSYEDLLEHYIGKLIDDEDAEAHRVIPPAQAIDQERAALFALLMIASYLDSIDTQMVRLVKQVTKANAMKDDDDENTHH